MVLPIIRQNIRDVKDQKWAENLLATGRTAVYTRASTTMIDYTFVVDRPQTIGLAANADQSQIEGKFHDDLITVLKTGGQVVAAADQNIVNFEYRDNRANSQHMQCPCSCGCIEPHEDDINQRNPISTSVLHFFRMADSNRLFQIII